MPAGPLRPLNRGARGGAPPPMLGLPMSSLIATLQVFLLLCALPLAMLAFHTSRARRSRHGSYLALASVLALLAAMGALVSLSLLLADDDALDPMLGFATPALTLAACGYVLRRSTSQTRRRRPG